MSGDERFCEDLLEHIGELSQADSTTTHQALERLCARIAERVHAAGVIVTACGEDGAPWLWCGHEEDLRTVAATQFRIGEGPCVEACASLQPVWADDGEAVRRWPRWAPQVVETGVRGMLSVPTSSNGPASPPAGTMLIAFAGAAPVETALRPVSTAAAIALRHLAQQRELRRAQDEVGQLDRALRSRVVIEQAKGFLAGQGGITVSEAFERLRGTARSSQRKLHAVAAEVLEQGRVTEKPTAARADTARVSETPLPTRP